MNSSFSSSYLNAGEVKTVGPYREFEVQSGDIIEAKAWVWYVYDNTKSKTEYNSTGEIMGNTEDGFGPNGINFGVNPFSPNTLGELPNAYLRIEVYDVEGNLLSAQRKVQYMTGGTSNWFQLNLKDTLENGFVKVFVANESAMDVWFDEVSITHQQGLIVQENSYYPFGMNMAGIEKQGTPDHKFQYNGKEKQEEFDLNWYDYEARTMDVQLARFNQIDPLANVAPGRTPYRYGFNNPLRYINPTGMSEEDYNGEIGTWNAGDEGLADVMAYWGVGANNNGNDVCPDGDCDKDKTNENQVEANTIDYLKPGEGTRKNKNGTFDQFNSYHNCGPHCTLDHFDTEDTFYAFGEVALFLPR